MEIEPRSLPSPSRVDAGQWKRIVAESWKSSMGRSARSLTVQEYLESSRWKRFADELPRRRLLGFDCEPQKRQRFWQLMWGLEYP